MDAPAEEVFKYMDMTLDEEEVKTQREAEKYFLDFLSTMYAQAPQQGEKAEFTSARRRFIENIKPKPRETPVDPKTQKKRFEWNLPKEALQTPPSNEGVEEGG